MRVVCASSVSPSCFLYHSSAPSAVGGVLRPILKSSNVPSDSEPSVNCNSCESDSVNLTQLLLMRRLAGVEKNAAFFADAVLTPERTVF